MDNSIVITANRACSLLYSYLCKYSGGVWLLPVNVCPDVPLTFCLANTHFEFVDIDKDTLCIDEKECLRKIKSDKNKYSGILFVRTYGYLSDKSDFFCNCKRVSEKIRIIDDRCLCIPSFDTDLLSADMILYSTGKSKQIDLGGGGIAICKTAFPLYRDLYYDGTDEQALYKKAYETNKILCKTPIGWLKISENRMIDQKYIDEIIYQKEKRIIYREKINSIYENNLPVAIQQDKNFQQWRFNIKVNPLQKTAILKVLFDNGLFASSHYQSANKLFDNESYTNSDRLFSETINLFNDMNYSEKMAIKTCMLINKTLRGGE